PNSEIKLFREEITASGTKALIAYRHAADSWAEKIGEQSYKDNVIVVPPFPETFELRDLDIGLVDEDDQWKEVVDVSPGTKQRISSMNDERPRIRVYANPDIPPGDFSTLKSRAK